MQALHYSTAVTEPELKEAKRRMCKAKLRTFYTLQSLLSFGISLSPTLPRQLLFIQLLLQLLWVN